jgi:hypothetical protein
LSLSIEIVGVSPKKPVPEEVAKIWAEEWANKEGRRWLTGRGFACRSEAFECCLEKVGGGKDLLVALSK